jgi:hypothetical protein
LAKLSYRTISAFSWGEVRMEKNQDTLSSAGEKNLKPVTKLKRVIVGHGQTVLLLALL